MEVYKADEGMVWKLKDSEITYGSTLYLGSKDTIERYEQVSKKKDGENKSGAMPGRRYSK